MIIFKTPVQFEQTIDPESNSLKVNCQLKNSTNWCTSTRPYNPEDPEDADSNPLLVDFDMKSSQSSNEVYSKTGKVLSIYKYGPFSEGYVESYKDKIPAAKWHIFEKNFDNELQRRIYNFWATTTFHLIFLIFCLLTAAAWTYEWYAQKSSSSSIQIFIKVCIATSEHLRKWILRMILFLLVVCIAIASIYFYLLKQKRIKNITTFVEDVTYDLVSKSHGAESPYPIDFFFEEIVSMVDEANRKGETWLSTRDFEIPVELNGLTRSKSELEKVWNNVCNKIRSREQVQENEVVFKGQKRLCWRFIGRVGRRGLAAGRESNMASVPSS